MSRINGEKARAAVELKRRTVRRVKERALRAEWIKAQPVVEKKAPVAAAVPAAERPKKNTAMSADALIESLRPAEKKPRAKKTE